MSKISANRQLDTLTIETWVFENPFAYSITLFEGEPGTLAEGAIAGCGGSGFDTREEAELAAQETHERITKAVMKAVQNRGKEA